jgi:predicted methyltransferase
MKKLFLICLLISSVGHAQAAEEKPITSQKINAALADERRTDEDKLRDANRAPLKTLEFLRLKDDMTVLELLPGGGWYTKILGPVLEEKGKLYLSIGTNNVAKLIDGQEGFASTEVIPFDGAGPSETDKRRYTVPEFSFGIRKIDLVLTFRNLHNFDSAGRANLNTASFQALKKGGYYGVVDHTRRHMQPDSQEAWRRIDPVQVIKEVESAGFRFVDYADVHYKLDDELLYEVGRKSVAGNTDRFTLLFEKP